MGKTWTETSGGGWKLTVTSNDPADGTPVQVFYGTKDEIADQLADAHGHATKRIAELKKGGAGGATSSPPPQTAGPRPLTAAERMQTVADLTDPAKVDSAVTRIMESVVGSVENLRDSAQDGRDERISREAERVALEFFDHTPDWHPSEHNKNALVGFMQTQGLSPLKRENFTRAFEALNAAGLLQKPPVNDNELEASQPERIAPTPPAPKAPTRVASGIRSSDFSGEPPRPTNRMKYSREQIANMSASNYKRLMTSDPELARCVEFYDKQQKRRVG